jgi:hypothetical protein
MDLINLEKQIFIYIINIYMNIIVKTKIYL